MTDIDTSEAVAAIVSRLESRLAALEGAQPKRANGTMTERSGVSIGLAVLIFSGVSALLLMVFDLKADVRVGNERSANLVGRVEKLETAFDQLREAVRTPR